jgi:hypothetical protein
MSTYCQEPETDCPDEFGNADYWEPRHVELEINLDVGYYYAHVSLGVFEIGTSVDGGGVAFNVELGFVAAYLDGGNWKGSRQLTKHYYRLPVKRECNRRSSPHHFAIVL